MIYIGRTLYDKLARHAARCHPRECCGILIGSRRDGATRVAGIIEAKNITKDNPRRSYQIDWATLMSVTRGLRGRRETIVGFYHSHPDGTSLPSQRDRTEAWFDHAYLIFGRNRKRATAMACWRIREEGGPFEEEGVELF